ncbi:hypothetical protein, partial [Bosea sp. (in: a-proteobacteria)]|uniref:hypothetical protein n=1 Tax=Bosea sp. (in: a-proteobacteria) TaxID=1871050 RepID=UPI00403487F3
APPVGKCDLGRNTTLGVIKPHSVLDGTAGLMLDCIQETFDITALQLFTLDKIAAAEFYEVSGVSRQGQCQQVGGRAWCNVRSWEGMGCSNSRALCYWC